MNEFSDRGSIPLASTNDWYGSAKTTSSRTKAGFSALVWLFFMSLGQMWFKSVEEIRIM